MNAYIVERDVLLRNIRLLVSRTEAAVYGVIKGGGYGLGLIPMAEVLKEAGVCRFAVTEVTEVRALRENGFMEEEILMLRETGLESELRELLDLKATVTVGSLDTVGTLRQIAVETGVRPVCHVKVDTGMGRYGFLPDRLEDMEAVYRMEALDVRGVYTHFNRSYDDEALTRQEFAAFASVCEALESRGIQVGLRHCCNSSAFLKYPEMHLDAVRLGSALLGRLSFPGDGGGLRPVGRCESRVEVLRTIPKGHAVGYGAGWKAKRETVIAVCGVGYYHGFGPPSRNDLSRFRDCFGGALSYVKAFLTRRSLWVTVNGKPARVLGHVGMVQTVFDVTDIPCKVGDVVELPIKPLEVKGMEIRFL